VALLAAASGPNAADPPDKSNDVVVKAPEPRFVAPTRRDRIGRIWAPVMISGHGPFRLVLDTGASRSAVAARVAQALGISHYDPEHVLLRGVTGNATVPLIEVESFTVGDLAMIPASLPIVPDPLGGADGVLGIEGLSDKRIFIDFRHDRITIARSRGQRAPPGASRIVMEHSPTGLIMLNARAAGVRLTAILDTGAQASIGNLAMHDAIVRRGLHGIPDDIYGVTPDVQRGTAYPSPTVELGGIEIRDARLTYGDVNIFSYWNLTRKPALLIGMDILGLLDILIIDYRHHEVWVRL
jgi:predicted aspartyl protease